MKSYTVNELEGLNFAKLSGDTNFIHTDKIVGYNSLFGHNIVHGVLVVLKFFSKIKLNQNYNFIKIIFKNPFKYKTSIKIKKIKKNNYFEYILTQEKIICANIKIGQSQKKNHYKIYKNKTYNKNYLVSEKIITKLLFKQMPLKMIITLYYLSKYVGTIYPGRNSLISEIEIYTDQNYIKSNKIFINSKLIDKRFPLIKNILFYKNYYINFKTLIRPELKIKLKQPNIKIINEIKSIKENLLIIGGSSGIGNDLLRLFLINKKIKIFTTYFKNKINLSQKNLIIKKINIQTDLKKIFNIIKKYKPITIYYFPTPKIFNKSKDKKLINLYKKYYIDYPIKIIKFADKFNSRFFYPSTTFIERENLSAYARTKLKGEEKITKLKKSNIEVSILRISEINTKQNLSLIDKKLNSFRYLLSKNKLVFNRVFFKK